LVLATIVALTLAVPAGQSRPDGPNRFPLAGLWDWLTTRPAWAFDRPATPVQGRGGPVEPVRVTDPQASRANGGNGRKPGKTPSTLDEWGLPPVGDVAEQPAARANVGFQATTSRRIQDGTSATADAFENADGSRSRKVYPKPVNFLGPDGVWRPFDTSLRPVRGGGLEVSASDAKVVFASAKTVAWGGGPQATEPGAAQGADTATRLVSVTLVGGESVVYGLSGAAPVDPSVDGPTATYEEILPDTDVRLTALGRGAKETMVLKSASAATEWVFPLRLTGLTPRMEADGAISLVGGDGAVKLVIPHGTMYDSARENAVSDAVRYELVEAGSALALKMVADAAWVRDPARVFPIMVDPTLAQGGNGSTFVQKDTNGSCCTNNNSGALVLSTGYHSSGPWNARAFVKFDNFSASYLGHKVSSARFYARVIWAGACASSVLRVHDVGTWQPSTVTNWNNQPALWGEVGNVTGTPTRTACVDNDEQDPNLGDWWEVTLNAGGLQTLNRWTAGDVNNGLAVVSDLNPNNANWKKIASVWTSSSPYILIDYTPNERPQVETAFPPHGYASPTLTPELIVRASDVDAWPKPLTYRYQVFDTAGAVVADSGATPISSTVWGVPAGSLEWGKAYTWGVVAFDGADVSVPYPLQGFSTQVPQPLITSSLAQNSSAQGFEPNVGNYTASVTDANVATVGPPLAIQRSYNSRDPRAASAFGKGWSTLLDARLRISGATAVITYPTGQDVAFGRKPDGTYQAPSGGLSNALKPATGGGFELRDRSGAVYLYTTPAGTDAWALTSITDLFGRRLSLGDFVSGRPGRITAASGRSLTLTWAQPAGASAWHVTSVATERTDPAVPGSVNTWTYVYSQDRLTKACPPGDAVHCTVYTYGTNTLLPTAVLDADPHTYLRLDDAASSPAAASSAVDSIDTTVGVYANVTSAAGELPGSTVPAAVFNGTSSRVELGKALPLAAAYQTVSLWFKTTSPGVLYSYQSAAVTDAAAVQWVPALYVDTAGKLRGQLWNGTANPMTSVASVNDGVWHHAALVAAGNNQWLYLDGTAVASLSGQITPIDGKFAYIGAGKWLSWPQTPDAVSYFNGRIRDFAFYSKPLTATQVQTIHQTGVVASSPLTRINRPGGGVQAAVEYDATSGVVRRVTDANGGVWQVNDASRSNAGQVYRSTVLGRAPKSYFRLADGGPQHPVNEVNGGVATYNQVTLGMDGGPLGDEVDVASFNGTSSYVRLPDGDLPKTKPASMSMWLRMPAGSSAGGVLWSYGSHRVEEAAQAWGGIPGLYVGTDGKLRAQLFWTGSIAPMVVERFVNDGLWHHVALSGSPAGNRQNLFLDGVQVGSLTSPILTDATSLYTAGYVGAGLWEGWTNAGPGRVGYWPGQIGEFAYFEAELSAGDIAAQYAGRTRGTSWLGVYPGNGGGGVGPATRLGQQCADATSVTGAGDFTGDGRPDVACRVANGDLHLYRGNGTGGFTGGPVPFAYGFNEYDRILWPGDFSGDGKPDLLARRASDGNLLLYRGDGQGAWITGTPELVGTGWWPTTVFTVGDFSGDGKADFFRRDESNGRLWLYRGNGASWYSDAMEIGTADWRARELTGGRGDFDGDGRPDIVFRNKADNHLYFVRGNGSGGFLSETPVKIADNQGERNAIFVVGDFTGDGKADLMFRSMVDPDRPVPLSGVPVKVTDVVDPAGNHLRNTYDLSAGGRQIEAINVLGKVTTYGYDTAGFVRTVTDPMGNQIIKEYDEKGNVKAETTCQDMSEAKCSTTYYSYFFNAGDPDDPRNGKLSEVRDGRSTSATDNRYLTTYAYDAKGNLVEVTDPLGRKKKNEFTPAGNVVADLAGLNGSARYVRMFGLTRATTAGFSLYEFEVYGAGCGNLALRRPVTVSSTEAGSGSTPQAAVDGSSSTRWSSAFSDNQWLEVDLGAVRAVNRVRLNWESAYGKSYRIEVSNDRSTWTTLASVADQDGTPVPPGLPTRITTAGGAAQDFSYAANGDVVRTVDAAGLATCYRRDGVGRINEQDVASDTYPSRVSRLTYDRLDRVATITEPTVLNRVTGATHTKSTTSVYDYDSNVLSATFADATGGDAPRTVAMEYNLLGQKTSQSDGRSHRTLYEYDPFGRVVKQTAPDGTITEAHFDPVGNQDLTKVNGQTIEARSYDAANRLLYITDAMGWITKRTYTDNNLLATVTRTDPQSGSTYVLESNVYDAAGNPLSQTANNGTTTTTVGIDQAGRTAWTTLDTAGVNRTVSYVYGDDDAVLSETVSGPGGSQTVDSVYDPAGRPIWQGVRMPGGVGGPDGWWQLNEVSGATAADSTPAARHGTLSNVSWGDGAASFNGTGEITTTGPVVATMQSFAVSAWVKVPAGGGGVIVGQDSGWRAGFELAAGDVFWADKPCGDANWGAIWLYGTSPVVPDKWTHVALVFDATTSVLKMYVNGRLEASGSNCGNGFDATGPLTIGRGKYDTQPNGRFTGGIDNVQAYRRALADADVAKLHAAGRAGNALNGNAIATSFAYDQSGNVTVRTDPNGNVSRFSYDQAGRLAQTVTPTVTTEDNGVVTSAPVITTTGYDTFAGVVEQRDGRGLVTRTERDANGQVVRQTTPGYTAPGGSTPVTMSVETFHDSMGRVEHVVDPLGRTTFYTYDQFGQVKTVKTPDLGMTTYAYHADGGPASVTDASGARRESTHDFLGRPATSTQLVRRAGQPTEALTTSYVYYGQSGWLQKVISPETSRGQTVLEYNNAGEVVKSTDPANNVTLYSYDFAGRNTLTTLPDGSKRKTLLDQAGRAIGQQELSPAGGVLRSTAVSYDGNGNVLTATDARGTVSTFTYDAVGRLTQSTQPISATDSIVNSFGYNANGQQTRFTDGRGGSFRTTFNTWNLPESEIDADAATFTTVYDAIGRVDRRLAPGGVSQTFSYDEMDNLVRVVGAGAEVATQDRVFDYDAVGRIISLSGPGGTNTLSYDDRGLLTSVTGPSGNSSYSYTPDGLPASRTDAAGTTGYTYDIGGRLKTISNSTAGLALSYDYNNLSQVSQIIYGSNQNRRVFGYDNLHRLQTDELKTAGGASVAKITYGWDANDNETSKTTAGFAGASANTYTYDWANRLTSWNATVYGYDKAGNRTQAGGRTFTYSPGNRLQTASDGTTYEYTARGTLRRTTVGTVSLETQSDAFDQVIRQYSTPTAFSEYTYDGLGRMLQAGFAHTGTGNDLAKDANTSYVRDPGGGLVGSKTGANTTYSWTDLHTDVVGQFTATATALNGSTTYEPFGKVNATNGMQGGLGYQSEWTDPQTKRVNMHSRWYNPDTGQFDSRDTVSVPNRYNFVNNSPLTSTDPTGHMANWRERDCNAIGNYCGQSESWLGWKSDRRKARSAEQQRTAEAAERARVARLKSLLPACMKQEKKVRGRPIDEVAGCEGAQKKCGQATGSRFARFDDTQYTRTLKDCTTVEVRPDGSCSINGLELRKDDAPCHDPYLVAKNVDNYAGRLGGYMPDGKRGDKMHITAIVINQAVAGAEAEKINEARATCQADWWCRNATTIGNIVDAIVSVVVFAGCTIATGGTGVLICAVGAAYVGGFIGEIVAGKAEGLAWDDSALWSRAIERGLTNAAMAAVMAPIGGAIGASLARPLASLGARFTSSAIGQSLSSAGSRLAATSGGQLATRAFGSRAGQCLTSVGTDLALSLATVPHSFDPSTKVLMSDGTTKAIGDIKLGERVVATDPDTDQTSSQPVTALHSNLDTDLVDVNVRPAPSAESQESGEGKGDRTTRGPTTTLHTTAHHPFWDATQKRWVEANDLKPGHSTLRGHGGQIEEVVDVTAVAAIRSMRDLTVATVHTYYVVAGATVVLVHNCGDGAEERLGKAVDDIVANTSKRMRPGTISESIGVRPSGLYVAVHTTSGTPGPIPGRLMSALTACSHPHGGCSEVSGFARLMDLGAEPVSTTTMGILSKRVGVTWHKQLMDSCSACERLFSALGVT